MFMLVTAACLIGAINLWLETFGKKVALAVLVLLFTVGGIIWATNQFRPTAKAFMQVSDTKFVTPEYAVGVPLQINVAISNKGTERAEDVVRYFQMALIQVGGGSESDTTAADERALTLFRSNAEKELTNQRGVPVDVGTGVWNTLTMPRGMSEQELNEFMQGRQRLYVYVQARWRGASQDYELCRWLQTPQSTKINNDDLKWYFHPCGH